MSRRSGQNGSEEISGNWYYVRFKMDIAGQEKKQNMRVRICPVSGPGKLSASERARRRKEIIAESGADTVEHFEKTVLGIHKTTFREQVVIWLEQKRTNKRKPVAPATAQTWECAIKNWLNPHIGDMPLDSIDALMMKNLVAKMDAGGLAPKSILNYTQIVKGVMESVRDERGRRLFNVDWDPEFLDMPVVDKRKQKAPCFSGDIVSGIARITGRYRMLWILCAATGLRIGEALGIDIKDVSPDCSVIKIRQKAWKGEIHDYLKTDNGIREVDLHSSVAALLHEYIGDRQSGLLFRSGTGRQLDQSNLLRRSLHPALRALGWKDAELGITKAGSHAFRRFRNTYLRNHTSTPEGIYKFWLGHAGNDMSDLYDKIRHDVAFRKEVAERAGVGFEVPKTLSTSPMSPKSPMAEAPEVAWK